MLGLPKDPMMLLSVINTHLRDTYPLFRRFMRRPKRGKTADNQSTCNNRI